MGHYKSNVRDLLFNLFEVMDLDAILRSGNFGDLDSATVRSMLSEAARQAEGPVAASFVDADRNPPVFDPATHSVALPDSFKKSLLTWQDSEWFLLGMSEELGGTAAPWVVTWAINELLLGANPGVFFYMLGPVMADVLFRVGNDEQKRWAKIAVDRRWGGTMVLTEPDAGSDVGAGRTKAIEQADGSWHIEGVKRFITGAESDDLAENIFHLVLARPEGAGPGTKGLSLFFVPKFHFDPHTGELGERNGVFVTNVEHKMGLKVSATCELTFGGHGIPAEGWLVGDVHNGIAQMFKVIENARMQVGTKAISTLSTGYLNALEYAKTRVQGPDLTQMADKTAPRVAIVRHPDVRRSLMVQKAYAEGLRAVYLYTAAHQDPVSAEQVSGADADLARRVNDLLLPIVKGVGSERAYQYLTDSLQTFGGSGYLQDYPIEQYIRDSKIDSLYEGTTAIQSLDFFFRKIARDQGAALAHLQDQISDFLQRDNGDPRLSEARVALATALGDVRAMTECLIGYLMAAQEQPRELYKIGLGSVRFLLAFGDLMIGWRLLEQAEIALAALAGEPSQEDRAFYEGKVAVADFFGRTVLPDLSSARRVVTSVSGTLMDLPDGAF
ncbi:acyl-CoA dehydrogenase [Nocardia gipuzkoensis]|uniref:acyl-CoA dehydrogenase n=1 Tax=Nocardia gipuzkoensis TaxID=2749991 RepID=UPI001E2C1449|nr:acyl-CoA dehydrogenase [Nocardia gipuzkoensis]UGT69036.1 acyl-CoA dehydrogenase [Nocardia gipuzkoensis]